MVLAKRLERYKHPQVTLPRKARREIMSMYSVPQTDTGRWGE